MRIWLDDTRDAPEGWTLATTIEQVIELLSTRGDITDLSLDYDLPETDPGHVGLEVLVALYEADAGYPTLHVHSANAYGAAQMATMIALLEERISKEEAYAELAEIKQFFEE